MINALWRNYIQKARQSLCSWLHGDITHTKTYSWSFPYVLTLPCGLQWIKHSFSPLVLLEREGGVLSFSHSVCLCRVHWRWPRSSWMKSQQTPSSSVITTNCVCVSKSSYCGEWPLPVEKRYQCNLFGDLWSNEAIRRIKGDIEVSLFYSDWFV